LEGIVRKSNSSEVIPGSNVLVAAIGGKRFISDVEFEERYGVPRKSLQNMRVLGRGPAFRKFGSSVRYDIRDIEAWIDSLPRGGAGTPSSAVKGA
jgi:hypothetical protein